MYTKKRTLTSWLLKWAGFLEAAKADMERKGERKMCCPCRKCGNTVMHKPEEVSLHVLANGFVEGYSRWTSHGEAAVEVGRGCQQENNMQYDHGGEEYGGDDVMDEDEEEPFVDEAPQGRMAEMLDDDHLRKQLEDPDDEREVRKFEKLVEDANTPLYDKADINNNVLEVTLELLKLKAKHNISDKGLTDMLNYLSTVFPKGNKLPKSTYEAKKITCPLGLDVEIGRAHV